MRFKLPVPIDAHTKNQLISVRKAIAPYVLQKRCKNVKIGYFVQIDLARRHKLDSFIKIS